MAAPHQSCGNIFIRHPVATGQIGETARDAQNAVKAARREPTIINNRIEQFATASIRRRQSAQSLTIKPRIQAILPRQLCFLCAPHAVCNRRTAFAFFIIYHLR